MNGADRTGDGFDLSRRNFLLAAAAASAAGLVGFSADDAKAGAAATPRPRSMPISSAVEPRNTPWKRRSGLDRRPNFLIVMVDEMRYPSVYESAALKAFRTSTCPRRSA